MCGKERSRMKHNNDCNSVYFQLSPLIYHLRAKMIFENAFIIKGAKVSSNREELFNSLTHPARPKTVQAKAWMIVTLKFNQLKIDFSNCALQDCINGSDHVLNVLHISTVFNELNWTEVKWRNEIRKLEKEEVMSTANSNATLFESILFFLWHIIM